MPCRTRAGPENGAPGSLTGDLKTAVQEAKDRRKWARAIVVENRQATCSLLNSN